MKKVLKKLTAVGMALTVALGARGGSVTNSLNLKQKQHKK